MYTYISLSLSLSLSLYIYIYMYVFNTTLHAKVFLAPGRVGQGINCGYTCYYYIYVLVLLHMRPHATQYVSHTSCFSYYFICKGALGPCQWSKASTADTHARVGAPHYRRRYVYFRLPGCSKKVVCRTTRGYIM